jgi:hypothetical protein
MFVARLGYFSNNPMDFRIRKKFCGRFGAAGGTLGQHSPGSDTRNNLTLAQTILNDGGKPDLFMYAQPISRADRAAGRVCTVTGMWAPGRFIVYVDGKPIIAEWAYVKSIAEKNTPWSINP